MRSFCYHSAAVWSGHPAGAARRRGVREAGAKSRRFDRPFSGCAGVPEYAENSLGAGIALARCGSIGRMARWRRTMGTAEDELWAADERR
jgi:hypothetical protein